MGKKKRKQEKNRSGRAGLQAVTLCISTAMVLILLGLVVLTGLVGRNLSSRVKENLVVTVMLAQDMTDTEAAQLQKKLRERPYMNQMKYVSKEDALKEGVKELGSDPSEFVGENPFLSSIELTLLADYANNDSLRWIEKELKAIPKVSEIAYQKDLVEAVNKNLAKISLVLLGLAVLLLIVSFSLINNTIRLGVYARRFSIHTMKLVGASWGFIRGPFVRKSVGLGVLAAVIACAVLGGLVYALYRYEPEILTVLTWKELAIAGGAVLLFGVIITAICAHISVNKFLRMKAGELYKI
ncbi:MAG: permease-like cell division protein FtsX [Prevotella sp.]|nr:permease-like cell division protein FtsX [Prevotella sp.]